MMKLAFYHPEIPQNTGTLLRVAACFGVSLELIGPLGFLISHRHFRRAHLDYAPLATSTIHATFDSFWTACSGQRVIALLAQGGDSYTSFSFLPSDILLLGPESTGLPLEIINKVQDRITIPMQAGARSLNVAIAGSIVLTEALRQCALLPTQAVA
ncbi:MAG: tRNA methyltransferase [Holosporales bacterium]|jgi:tRNA (cytidine/uridine-2'-O-)-methyltransferase|nr:tRNA methyltransferase [Holosporales bacterium]